MVGKGCGFLIDLSHFHATSLPKEDVHTFSSPCCVPAVWLDCTTIGIQLDQQAEPARPEGPGAQKLSKGQRNNTW